MPVNYLKDDAFLIPFAADSAAVGRVVLKLRGSALVTVYLEGEGKGTSTDLDKLAKDQPILLVETIDTRIKQGTWELIGKFPPLPEVRVPVYKVQLEPDGDFFEQFIDGRVGNRLDANEAVLMRRQKSFSPAAVEMALQALCGISPWLPAFDYMKFDPLM